MVTLYKVMWGHCCRFEVNFGQQAPWFPPAPNFLYIMQYPVHERVAGLKPPSTKSSCEVTAVKHTSILVYSLITKMLSCHGDRSMQYDIVLQKTPIEAFCNNFLLHYFKHPPVCLSL